MEDDEVAGDDLAACDALLLAVADDEGAGAAQVLEGIEGTLGLAVLEKCDADDEEDGGQKDGALLVVAEDHVEAAAADEQEEHGLAHDLDGDAPQGLGGRCGEFIGAMLTEQLGGLGRGESSRHAL